MRSALIVVLTTLLAAAPLGSASASTEPPRPASVQKDAGDPSSQALGADVAWANRTALQRTTDIPLPTVEDLRADAAEARPSSAEVDEEDVLRGGDVLREGETSPTACDGAWGTGPEYEDDGFAAWSWVAIDRFSGCSKHAATFGDLRLNRHLGILPMLSAVQTSTNSMTADLVIQTGVALDATNSAPSNWKNTNTLTLDFACIANVPEVACSTSDGAGETRTVAGWENGVISVQVDFGASSGLGQDGVAHSAIYLTGSYTDSVATAPILPVPEKNMLPIRCDHADYVGAATACVMTHWTPTLRWDLSSTTHPQISRHIHDALYRPEQTTMSHQYGPYYTPGRADLEIPLTRNFYGNRNRTQIEQKCNYFFPFRDPGSSCDEYPFATSYQNANYQSSFSVRPVPLVENQSQGGTLNGFYIQQRILDGDPYYTDTYGQPETETVDAEIDYDRAGYCTVTRPNPDNPQEFIIDWQDPPMAFPFYCFTGLTLSAEAKGWSAYQDSYIAAQVVKKVDGQVTETYEPDYWDTSDTVCGDGDTCSIRAEFDEPIYEQLPSDTLGEGSRFICLQVEVRAYVDNVLDETEACAPLNPSTIDPAR